MDAVLVDFRDSLRDGMGLWEALEKYDITLKYAMDHMDKPLSNPKPRSRPYSRYGKYIYRMGPYYVLQRSINNKTANFGTYNNLVDAKKVRNYFLEHGWHKSKLDMVCKELGVERRRK